MLMEHLGDIHEMSGDTVPLLRKVRRLVDAGICPKMTYKIGLHLHAITRRPSCEHYFNKLWAVPGMANYLLNERLGPGLGGPGAKTLCYWIFNTLIRTAIVPAAESAECDEGFGRLRRGDEVNYAQCRASLQRAADLFLDKKTRTACESAMAPGTSLLVTLTAMKVGTPLLPFYYHSTTPTSTPTTIILLSFYYTYYYTYYHTTPTIILHLPPG
ncbi:hypothetical protein B484DRAFT_206442 [Ochromonadaceae sp. CCMP2298]|nr:hypothetical protein B484DRAFT_206442 [Ochromonadaceae sp. CCMP2298]